MKEQITGVVRQLLWLSPTIVSADVVERGCFPNSPSEPFPMQAPDCHVFLKQQLGGGLFDERLHDSCLERFSPPTGWMNS